jgi:hypothetical protein
MARIPWKCCRWCGSELHGRTECPCQSQQPEPEPDDEGSE